MNNPYAAPDAALTDFSTADETYDPDVFSFRGRIGRLRYLAYTWGVMLLLAVIAGILSGVLVFALGKESSAPAIGIVMMLIYIPILGSSFVMTIRRLNDLDKSGWLSLLMLLPLVNFIFGLYLVFGGGTQGTNQYGPKPSKNSTLVLIFAWILPFIAVIGILAAIAIPAYQQYVLRAKAASALQQTQQPLQQPIQQQIK